MMDVYKQNYKYSCRKKVCFKKEWVFLAKFASEKERQETIEQSIIKEGLGKAWIIHGDK